MSESPTNPDQGGGVATERRIGWDALAAIIASLVGLLALVVAGYTAYIQRQQVSAQVWPHLHIGNSSFPPAIYVQNQGVGPAIVRSVEVLVDGKPQPDWDHVFAAVGMPGNINTVGPTMDGYVLTPGYKMEWVNFEFSRDQYQSLKDSMIATAAGGSSSPASSAPASYEMLEGRQRVLFRQFLDGAKRSRLQVRICYCSTLGDCKLAMWAVGQRTQQSPECGAVPEADWFRG